jgi:hypothetical protein
MTHVFLDTNILLDQCFRRKADDDASLLLMRIYHLDIQIRLKMRGYFFARRAEETVA